MHPYNTKLKTQRFKVSRLHVTSWHDLIWEDAISNEILDRLIQISHRKERKGENLMKKCKTVSLIDCKTQPIFRRVNIVRNIHLMSDREIQNCSRIKEGDLALNSLGNITKTIPLLKKFLTINFQLFITDFAV